MTAHGSLADRLHAADALHDRECRVAGCSGRLAHELRTGRSYLLAVQQSVETTSAVAPIEPNGPVEPPSVAVEPRTPSSEPSATGDPAAPPVQGSSGRVGHLAAGGLALLGLVVQLAQMRVGTPDDALTSVDPQTAAWTLAAAQVVLVLAAAYGIRPGARS